MQFMIFISFGTAALTGFAILLIGQLILKLRLKTIQVSKGVADENTLQIPQINIDKTASGTEIEMTTANNGWQSYTINLKFGDELPLLGWLLVVIGVLSVISSLIGLVFAMNVVSMGGSYNIKLPLI